MDTNKLNKGKRDEIKKIIENYYAKRKLKTKGRDGANSVPRASVMFSRHVVLTCDIGASLCVCFVERN